MRVLIAYDGSEYAKAAIYDLARAGLAAGTEVCLLTVGDSAVVRKKVIEPYYRPRRGSGETMLAHGPLVHPAPRDPDAVAEEGTQLILSRYRQWKAWGGSLRDAAPASAITQRAAAWRANLIVVGSHGATALKRLILGSVSQRVLGEARCSVRVGRNPELRDDLGIPLADEPPRILLAIEEPSNSAAAVDAVVTRSWPAGTCVRVVTVAAETVLHVVAARSARLPSDPAPDALTFFHERVETVAKDLQEAGLDTGCAVLEGEAAPALIREAERWGADCIILGAQCHSPIDQLFQHSVSGAVAAGAHCSVEVVR